MIRRMSPLRELIRTPRLVTRGGTSDLLLPVTLARMAVSGGETLESAETRHAQALPDPPQIGTIRLIRSG